jgi:hypothetical protein
VTVIGVLPALTGVFEMFPTPLLPLVPDHVIVAPPTHELNEIFAVCPAQIESDVGFATSEGAGLTVIDFAANPLTEFRQAALNEGPGTKKHIHNPHDVGQEGLVNVSVPVPVLVHELAV